MDWKVVFVNNCNNKNRSGHEGRFLFLFLRLLLFKWNFLFCTTCSNSQKPCSHKNWATFRSGPSRMHTKSKTTSFNGFRLILCVEWNEEAKVSSNFSPMFDLQKIRSVCSAAAALQTEATFSKTLNKGYFDFTGKLNLHSTQDALVTLPQQEALCTGFSMQHARANQRTNMVTNPPSHTCCKLNIKK